MAKILGVDDDEVSRLLMGRLLQDAGHETVYATDGEVALERITSGDFEIIVTDLAMPGLNGLRLIQAIKESRVRRVGGARTRRALGPVDALPVLRAGARAHRRLLGRVQRSHARPARATLGRHTLGEPGRGTRLERPPERRGLGHRGERRDLRRARLRTGP